MIRQGWGIWILLGVIIGVVLVPLVVQGCMDTAEPEPPTVTPTWTALAPSRTPTWTPRPTETRGVDRVREVEGLR